MRCILSLPGTFRLLFLPILAVAFSKQPPPLQAPKTFLSAFLPSSEADQTRRSIFHNILVPLLIPSSAVGASELALVSDPLKRETEMAVEESLTIPLKYIPGLSAYVLYYQVGGERFGAILDSGSPFLMVPNYCNKRKWGCYTPESSRPSGLQSTYEKFDNTEGEVEWRTAAFAFDNATGGSMMGGPTEMIFGVLSESLMTGPGGVFLGLIRDTDDWIRPSFLGQTNVKAFDIDLRNTENTKSLTLYTTTHPIWRAGEGTVTADYIPLVRDLNRKYGDPVMHYTAKASEVWANGKPVLNARDKKPVYVIFDTGVTGMVVSGELLDQRYAAARKDREKSLWGSVNVIFRTHRGNTVSLSAQKPVTTPLGTQPWPKFKNAHLIVVGLAFLDGHKVSIDIDGQKLLLED